jgi:hypothetical protein
VLVQVLLHQGEGKSIGIGCHDGHHLLRKLCTHLRDSGAQAISANAQSSNLYRHGGIVRSSIESVQTFA